MSHVDERRWHLDPERAWADTIATAVAELNAEGINNGVWHVEGEWLVFLIHAGRRKKRRSEHRAIAECGTDPGYFRHVRTLKERACDACREAHATANREQSRKRGVKPSPKYAGITVTRKRPPRRECASCGATCQSETPLCRTCTEYGPPPKWIRRGLIWVAEPVEFKRSEEDEDVAA